MLSTQLQHINYNNTSLPSQTRIKYLFIPRPGVTLRQHKFYRELFPKIMKDIEAIENNWRTGNHNLQRINCRSENSKGVYCLQYDDDKIVSGLRDNTIKIWSRSTLQCCMVSSGRPGGEGEGACRRNL